MSLGFCMVACGLELKATTIFNNTGTPTGGLVFGSLNGEVGDQVQVAGTDRYVTQLQIGIYPQGGFFPNGTAGAADVEARIYANDGPAGNPGSLLWDSGRLFHVSYPGNVNLLTFAVPQVLVPDTFTWTLQYSNAAPLPLCEVFVNTPTVGSSQDFFWVHGAGSPWQQINGGEIDNLMARVEAVPEPSVFALTSLLAVALLLGIGIGRFKNRNRSAVRIRTRV